MAKKQKSKRIRKPRPQRRWYAVDFDVELAGSDTPAMIREAIAEALGAEAHARHIYITKYPAKKAR